MTLVSPGRTRTPKHALEMAVAKCMMHYSQHAVSATLCFLFMNDVMGVFKSRCSEQLLLID